MINDIIIIHEFIFPYLVIGFGCLLGIIVISITTILYIFRDMEVPSNYWSRNFYMEEGNESEVQKK